MTLNQFNQIEWYDIANACERYAQKSEREGAAGTAERYHDIAIRAKWNGFTENEREEAGVIPLDAHLAEAEARAEELDDAHTNAMRAVVRLTQERNAALAREAALREAGERYWNNVGYLLMAIGDMSRPPVEANRVFDSQKEFGRVLQSRAALAAGTREGER